MKTAKGTELPPDFAAALDHQPQLLHVLDQMRPSCQLGYVQYLGASVDDDARQQRIERALAKIARWGARHDLIDQESSA
jgi:uncharacterized protein YdeI (YjbR/CyaY-like superfamily)